jgi:DNA-binding transcriptional ArsR family regulator
MTTDLDTVFKALAHPLRRQILAWLKDPQGSFPLQTYGHEHGVCAGQIEQRCGLAQSTVSSHLTILHRAGLLRVRKLGQNRFFERNEEALQQALSGLLVER